MKKKDTPIGRIRIVETSIIPKRIWDQLAARHVPYTMGVYLRYLPPIHPATLEFRLCPVLQAISRHHRPRVPIMLKFVRMTIVAPSKIISAMIKLAHGYTMINQDKQNVKTKTVGSVCIQSPSLDKTARRRAFGTTRVAAQISKRDLLNQTLGFGQLAPDQQDVSMAVGSMRIITMIINNANGYTSQIVLTLRSSAKIKTVERMKAQLLIWELTAHGAVGNIMVAVNCETKAQVYI